MTSDNKITDQNGFEQYPKINYDNKETFESYIEKWKKRNKSNACMYDYIKQLHDQEIKDKINEKTLRKMLVYLHIS